MSLKEDKVRVGLGSTQATFIILFCPRLLYTLLLLWPNVCRAPCTLDPDPPSLGSRCGLICHCSPESSKGLTAVRDRSPGGSDETRPLKAGPAWSRSSVPWKILKCPSENKTAPLLEEHPIPSHPLPSPSFLRSVKSFMSAASLFDLRCARERRAGFPKGEGRVDVWKTGRAPHPLGSCVSLQFSWYMLCFLC